ncbi:MAG: ABC transporter permease [Holosporales bacterium]|jgi:putrescine transport system permease protein|nr:ABC transporter permease [Holosporales bacterium]
MIKKLRATTVFLIFGLMFLCMPIVFLIKNSFDGDSIRKIVLHFCDAFNSRELIDSLITSLKIAFVAATSSVVLGILAAVFTTVPNGAGRKCKKFLDKMVFIPMIIPEAVIGLSLLMFFIKIDLGISCFVKIIVAHTLVTVAYVYSNVKSRLLEFDTIIEEAAIDLGAKPFTIFFKIKIPLMKRHIFTGWALAFIISFDDPIMANFLSGGGTTTFPVLIFSKLTMGKLPPEVNAFVVMLISVIMLVVFAFFFLGKSKKVYR